MTTSSARPEALRDHGLRIRREAHLADDALATVATQQAVYLDRCAAGHPLGQAAFGARRAAQLLGDLSSGLASVADAFSRADGGTGICVVGDGRLARSIEQVAPGLTADVGIHDGISHEQGHRLGASLADATPEAVTRALALEAAATTDPAFAAGVLVGLGPAALRRLAVQAQHDSAALGGTPANEVELWRQLGRVFATAADSVQPLAHPGAAPVVDPGGLDLGLITALGRSWSGRLALRNLTEHLRRPPTAVTVAVAHALLLGETASSDVAAAQGALSLAGLSVAPGTAGEAQALRLLAADPMASFRLELLHPGAASPALLLLARDGWSPAPDAAARNLHNVAVVSVARGWAQPWADPLVGTGVASNRLPVPRVLDGLLDRVIDIDAPAYATPALSRALASVVATHPAAFQVATAQAEIATSARGKHAPARFYQAIARDLDALRAVTEVLAAQHRDAIIASVGSRSPGTTTVHAAVVDTVVTHHSVELLIEGAHDAGHEHHVGVVIATVLGNLVVGKGLPALGARVAGPAGSWVGSQGAKVARGAIADYRDDHEDTYDGRERDARQELERGAPLAAAIAMSQDPAWAPRLRFPRRGLQPGELARLDVGTSDTAHRRFQAWLDAQDDPQVTEVLAALTPPDT